jgi:hypothetical protein
VLLGGLVIAGAVEAVTLALAVGDLNHGVVELTDASAALGNNPANWTAERINSAAGLNVEGGALISNANNRLSRDPILSGLSHVPFLGEQLTALLDLSNTSVQGSAAFDDAIAIARAVDRSRTSTDPPGPRLLGLMSEAEGPWTDADARLSPALNSLRADLARRLLPPIAHRAQQALAILQPIDDLAKVGAVAAKYGATHRSCGPPAVSTAALAGSPSRRARRRASRSGRRSSSIR